VWRTSGSTSQGRFLEISHEDFDEECDALARGLEGVFQPGERVANLFVGGGLRASFLLTTHTLRRLGVVELPILYDTPLDQTVDLLVDWRPTAVLGLPATLQRLAEELGRRGLCLEIPTVLYAGEHLYADQRRLLEERLACRTLAPLTYGAVDTGPVAVPERFDGRSVYRALEGFAHFELLDSEGRLVTAPDRPGDLLITNLSRRLSPVVRYPVGDRARWIEGPGDGRFELLERTAASLRLGPVTVDHRVVVKALESLPGLGATVQLVARHQEGHERLLCRCLFRGVEQEKESVARRVRDALEAEYPYLAAGTGKALIARLGVELVNGEGFTYRSGKRPAVIDERIR
jgi:phenylacetate-CoA ligase